MKRLMILMMLVFTSGCGDGNTFGGETQPRNLRFDVNSVLVHGGAVVNISVGKDGFTRSVTNPTSHATSTLSVVVVNNAASTFSLNSFSSLTIPTPTGNTTMVDLGTISVNSIFDNDLMHCGSGNTHKCTTTGIGAYWSTSTVGLSNGLTAGDNELMPVSLSSGLTVLTNLSQTALPGLVLNTATISGGNVKTSTLCSTAANCSFDFQGDFTNVSSGTFSGSITIVYFIAN